MAQDKVTQKEAGVCRKRVLVPHVRQQHNWDCGLACVLMIVHAHGMKHVDLRYLRDICGTTSIWTVDIAHLLRHFNLQVKFFTVTLGANPAYADEKFYKEHMRTDEVRVHELFKSADKAGIQLSQTSIKMDDLRSACALSRNLVLILVDKRVLQAGLSSPDNTSPVGGKGLLCCGVLSSLYRPEYVGHYILLYDYSYETKEFSIRDPASHSSRATVDEDTLEKARKSFGTDEDVIIVPFSN